MQSKEEDGRGEACACVLSRPDGAPMAASRKVERVRTAASTCMHVGGGGGGGVGGARNQPGTRNRDQKMDGCG